MLIKILHLFLNRSISIIMEHKYNENLFLGYQGPSHKLSILLLLLLSSFTPWEFFTSVLADGLLLILGDCKSPQVSRTLLSILAVLNNAVVWMVSTHSLISKSSSPFINPLVNVPRVPITIGINFTFIFHSFFNSLARLRYLSFFSLSFNFTF